MDALSAFAQTNTAALVRAAASRGALGHALIFSGAGDRVTAARYAAAALECTADVRPCLQCAHCRKVMAGIHPDVVTVLDPGHVNLSVEVIRSVRTDAFIRPNEGACKVYLFEDCARLTEQDQNVLLKTLEEGPPYAAFLFCAENTAALLPTVRSRCVELRTAPDAGAAEEDPRVPALCRALLELSAADRAAYLLGLEQGGAKKEDGGAKREDVAALLGGAKDLFAQLLFARCGAREAGAAARSLEPLTRRLTNRQILGTIDLLEKYRAQCAYNVGPGLLLGALAAEWETLL